MVETLIGGGLTLAGVAIAQWWQSRRDEGRWRKEASRRFYDQRSKAYVAFLDSLNNYKSGTEHWNPYTGTMPPSQLEAEDLQSLTDRLVPIKVFGSKEAYALAEESLGELWHFMQRDGSEPEALQNVLSRYVSQIRVDLDIPEVGVKLEKQHLDRA